MNEIKVKPYSRNGKGSASKLLLTAIALFSLGGCSTMNSSEVIDSGNVINDPYEEMNRKVMSFNMAVDHTLINPVIRGYRTVTPQPARTGIQNFLRNLRAPIDLLNQILQGDLAGARNITLRAAINSSLGLGGIFDVAGYEGIEYEPEDFGQTLAVWGIDHGPYFVAPFIGASSLRDYTGFFADSMADPFRWYLHNINKEGLYYAKAGANYLTLRDSLHDTLTELELSSFDYYAAVRSTYYQHRKAMVNDVSGKPDLEEFNFPEIPDFEDDY